jgi:hypothetical protein
MPTADCCEHGNKSSGSIKCEEFRDQLNDYQVFNDADPMFKVVPVSSAFFEVLRKITKRVSQDQDSDP